MIKKRANGRGPIAERRFERCEAKAVARYVRIAPRKARLVIDLIRGKSVEEALAILRFTPRAASPIIEKVLRSAVANAEHNYNMDTSAFISKSLSGRRSDDEAVPPAGSGDGPAGSTNGPAISPWLCPMNKEG